MDILKKIKNNVIISLQAMKNEPLHNEICINAMAESIINLGGISALRLAGGRDIKNIKTKFPQTVVIGITKLDEIPKNYKELVYITPTIEDCSCVIEAGADIVAFDGTMRKRPGGETLNEIVNFVKSKGKLAMADVATFEEAKNAAELGCDIVSTTLSGYTEETQNNPFEPDFELVQKIKRELDIFTILEGKIWELHEAQKAFEIGADAVVIGSAVTRPQLIAKRFLDGVKKNG